MWSRLRATFFWIHLALGLGFALVLCFFACTGSILAFQPQIVSVAEKAVRAQERREGECIAPSEWVAAFQQQTSEPVSAVQLFADTQRPALITTASAHVFLLDPCTGARLQAGYSPARSFFVQVRELHSRAATPWGQSETLHSIAIAANLTLPPILLSGLLVWLPRRWTRASLRASALPRLQAKGRAFEWNLHNVSGVWFAVPLLLISLSGSVMAYDWVNALLYRVAGSPSAAAMREERKTPSLKQSFSALDNLRVAAAKAAPDWRSVSVRMPLKAAATAATVDRGNGSQPQRRTQIVIAEDGVLMRVEPFESLVRGRQWRIYSRYLHTGELFGVAGQTVAMCSAFAGLLLVGTGVLLSLRRLRGYLSRVLDHRRQQLGNAKSRCRNHVAARGADVAR